MAAPMGMHPPSSGNADGQPSSWNDVVRLAAHAFEVSIAFVRVGEEQAIAGAGETVSSADLWDFYRRLDPIEAPIVIEDAAVDSRVADVETPVRFMAAAPVYDVERQLVGVLGLADVVPRAFSDVEVNHLRTLAELVGLRPREPLAGQTLEAIVQHAARGIVVTDRHERFRWVNDGFAQLCGYAFEELYGRKPRDLLQGPDTDPDTLNAIRERVQTGEGFTAELVNYRNDGEPYWVHIEAEPIAAAGDQPVGFIAFETEVTEQKTREQVRHVERDMLRAALDTAGVLVVLLDREGRILHFSEACRRLTGYEADEIVGTRLVDRLVPEEEHATVAAVMRAHRAGERHGTFTCHWVSRSGERWLLEWTTTAVTDVQGNVAYLAGTGTNLTERRRTATAALTASDAERLRLTQDLRILLASPLMGAAMMAKGMEQRAEHGGDVARSDIRALVDRIKRIADRMRALSNTLIAEHLRSEELGTALQRLAVDREEETGVPIDVGISPELPSFDDDVAAQLYRIAHEAIHRALRYAAPGRVWVRLIDERGHLVLTVRDDGLGRDETEGRDVANRLMRQRAEAIGATLSIEPVAPRGTVVRCELAVSDPERPSNG